jgi:hypothetical protein
MSEKTYPQFRTSKDIDIRFAPQVGVMSCGYNHLVRAFGIPTFSVDNNDTFEGTEQCAWNVQFENGLTVCIAEERGFGKAEQHYERATSWKVNSRDERTYNWIKQIIRDSNPNVTGA